MVAASVWWRLPGGVGETTRTIVNGSGSIYRGPIAGAQPVLRSGNGTFFNTQRLDVNDVNWIVQQRIPLFWDRLRFAVETLEVTDPFAVLRPPSAR